MGFFHIIHHFHQSGRIYLHKKNGIIFLLPYFTQGVLHLFINNLRKIPFFLLLFLKP